MAAAAAALVGWTPALPSRLLAVDSERPEGAPLAFREPVELDFKPPLFDLWFEAEVVVIVDVSEARSAELSDPSPFIRPLCASEAKGEFGPPMLKPPIPPRPGYMKLGEPLIPPSPGYRKGNDEANEELPPAPNKLAIALALAAFKLCCCWCCLLLELLSLDLDDDVSEPEDSLPPFLSSWKPWPRAPCPPSPGI